MTTHLVCYSDARYRHAQDRLVASATRNGVDKVHAFGPEKLRHTEFFTQHRAILDLPRGAGYWLWKPYYIREVLRKASAGDVVIYVDSGAELIGSVAPLVKQCREADGLLLFRNFGRENKYWTKRDCYVRMSCDTSGCREADQVNAAFGVFLAGSSLATELVDEWLDHCTDPQLLTDLPSTCGLPELPDYITHLHDQAILSLLAFRRRLPLYRDPSQLGNHRKPPAYRTPGEYLDLPYTKESCDRSKYPTLIDHHRQTEPPPTGLSSTVRWTKRIIRKVVPKKHPNPYFTVSDLSDSITKNRETLASVGRWFDPSADRLSQFNYGVPKSAQKLLDLPVGPLPNIPDLIGSVSESLGDRLNYLEIGVSVGKNFLQQIRAGKLRTLTGFDIEEIHPNLESRLTRGERIEWTPTQTSLKRGTNSLTTLADQVKGNRIRYLSGDVFDESCWERLKDKRFNFIYSDALHRPEGLMFEWRMIERYRLLDPEEFVMVWDDLGGYMSLAFDRICEQVQAAVGDAQKLTLTLPGWMGSNEYPHQIGLLVRLRNPPTWLKKHLTEDHKSDA